MSRNLVVPSLKKKRRVKCCQSRAAECLQQHQGRNTILVFQPERDASTSRKRLQNLCLLCTSTIYSTSGAYQGDCKLPPRCAIRCGQTGKQNTVNEMIVPLTQHRRLAAGARELILLTTTELLVFWTILEGIWHPRKE